MTIPVGGEIGDEVHEHSDQVLTFVSGTGEADLAGHTHPIGAGDQCAVPAGTKHNFRNTGGERTSRRHDERSDRSQLAVPSHASAATTAAAVPVSNVGSITGAKFGEWLAGMSVETVPAASALA